jgi:hypothetical protein
MNRMDTSDDGYGEIFGDDVSVHERKSGLSKRVRWVILGFIVLASTYCAK